MLVDLFNGLFEILIDLIVPDALILAINNLSSFILTLWVIVREFLFTGADIVKYFMPYFVPATLLPIVLLLELILLVITVVIAILKLLGNIIFFT